MGAIWLLSLADWCREAVGPANVTEEPGWQTRSRGSGGYTAGPTHIGIHHTAGKTSPENDKRYMWYNADAKPIGSLYLARDGHVTVGCGGASNTQGKGKALINSNGVKVPENKQNEFVLSIEAANDGVGEPWPQAQQDAYVKLCAVLCKKLGLTAGDCLGHFETAPGRKADPAGPSKWEDGTGLKAGNTRVWNMDKFRGDIFQKMMELDGGGAKPEPEPEKPKPEPEKPKPIEGVENVNPVAWYIVKGDSPWSVATAAYGSGSKHTKLDAAAFNSYSTPGKPVFVDTPDVKGTRTEVKAGEGAAAIIRRLVGSNDYPSKQMFETFELWNGGADRVFAPGDIVNMPVA